MTNEKAERELDIMPFDKVFYIGNGNQELCHATGIEVQDEDGTWWNEYQDSDGDFYYGR